MLTAVVCGLGHDARNALDGSSALSAAISYHPDVVLLDLGLPVMNGIEVARELRRAGFDEHLTKPTDPRTLADLLMRFASDKA